MEEEPTKEQMAERIRQKLTETMFWLYQAADVVPDDVEARQEIERIILELEKLDLNVAKAFSEAANQRNRG